MRSTTTTCLSLVLLLVLGVAGEQQRILRRVIKSTPTATNLARVRLVQVRSASAETGAVSEISSKEAASFGMRANETAASSSNNSPAQGLKSKQPATTVASTTSSTTSTTTATPSSSSAKPTAAQSTTTSTQKSAEASKQHKSSDRQQAAPQTAEVELLASAPSSWQHMMAVEAPAAMLIATGARSSAASSDLASSASSAEESASSSGDFLRSASSTKGSSYTASGETFSRLRQQQQSARQQTFFHPPARPAGKTSPVQATKTHWYQSTTPRPAPIVQEQQYEQQNEQYVEQQQQQQVEYGAAPLGQAEPFAFDFKTEDNSGNGQYRKEESDKNGVVRGSYGYTDANGIYRHVEYVADQNGFRANIKSNEPGLIGETQPANIQMASGAQPQGSQRVQASPNVDNGDWAPSNNQGSSADLALAPPDFESSHKSDRIRAPRHYRN